MGSFEEFGAVSDRRRADLNLRRRRNIRIAGTALSAVLLLAIVGTACVLYNSNTDSAPAAQNRAALGRLRKTSKSIQIICNSTDYKQTCISSLSGAIKRSNGTADDPKDLIKASMSALLDEMTAAFNRTRALADMNPEAHGAVEDCRQLLEDSEDEIKRSMESIGAGGIDKILEKSSDIRTWLSSVMSYQQTCIDGFPEGKLKAKLQKALNAAKEMTSNSLAILGRLSDFFETLDIPEGSSPRVLLEETKKQKHGDQNQLHEEEFPSWMQEEHQRVLKELVIKRKPNVTVAQDGSGNFKTISKALASMPKKYTGRYVIHIKAGVYHETVRVTKKMVNLMMYGDGSNRTIITGSKNFVDGVRTFLTATFAVAGDNFMAMNMGIRNTAGPAKHQAVALRVQSDRSVFFKCRFDGYQDTLYAQAKRQFYRSCVITGTVDFIFGDSAAIFQNCAIVLRRPLDGQKNVVLAHGRSDRHETTGFVLHKCRIVTSGAASGGGIRSYLGRPWKAYARQVIMESEIRGGVEREGYVAMDGGVGLDTLRFGEFKNTGPGAQFSGRVSWKGVKLLKTTTVQRFTVARFIQGDAWINGNNSGVVIPVRYGLYTN